MLTNNTCDVEKDIESGRKTLPVLLGRSRARTLYHALVWIWIALVIYLAGCVLGLLSGVGVINLGE